MTFRDRYRFDEISNVAEDLVIEELGRQLAQKGIDDTVDPDLVLDMAACALNVVKPMYRVNLLGRMYAQAFHDEYHAEIKQAVRDAILKVLSNP